MNDIKIGQIVYSKAGRDKGGAFVVVGVRDNYALLADGKIRKLAKPKLKKIIHIQITKTVNADIRCRLENGLNVLDADIRRAIAAYENGKV